MTSDPRNVLFLSPPVEDYLAVGLLHGLRALLGDRVIDFPRYEVAYQSYPADKRGLVYGRGFSSFFELPALPVNRDGVEARLLAGEFDLIIFPDIWRQYELFAQLRPMLSPRNTIVVDGHDSPNVYPHAGFWWRQPRAWLQLPRADTGFLYFKREWTEDTQFNVWHRALPRLARRRLPAYRGLRPTSFGFIQRKIVTAPPAKTKDFPRHVVDAEVAALVPGSATTYAFDSEADYYADLRSARFGITTKRSGWDCMRHYEIAANGAVPCFRDLEDKPETCAPHGLVPGINCITYRSAADLMRDVGAMDPDTYARLQSGALEWVGGKTTSRVAAALLRAWGQRS